MENRKSVPKPHFSNIMLVKSVKEYNPNPTKIQEMHIFLQTSIFPRIRKSQFYRFLRDFVGRVARLSRKVGSALSMRRTFQRFLISLHLAAFPEAKQSNQNT